MTTELDRPTPDLVHPITGECLVLADASDEKLAQFIDEAREYKRLLQEAVNAVNREALRRMDEAVRQGSQDSMTQRIGPYKLSAPATAFAEEIDGEGLYDDLIGLADTGVIGLSALDACIPMETVYKPQRAKLTALAKVVPAVGAAVAARTKKVPKTRYVKVERV